MRLKMFIAAAVIAAAVPGAAAARTRPVSLAAAQRAVRASWLYDFDRVGVGDCRSFAHGTLCQAHNVGVTCFEDRVFGASRFVATDVLWVRRNADGSVAVTGVGHRFEVFVGSEACVGAPG